MTNREAIDILRVINPPRESKRVFDKFIQARDMAISALKKQEVDRWRSVVKNGNPKESDSYLVSSNDKIVFVLYYSLEHGWDGWWNDRIIAWRPLPEPYQEEES